MNRIQQAIQAYFKDELFLRNQNAVCKRNNTIVRIILIGAIICFIFLFCASFSLELFQKMQRLYVLLVAIFSVMLTLSYLLKEKAVYWLFYTVFLLFISLCTYSSSIIFPDSISVMVLLALFIFPALFLDKGWRVSAVSVLTATVYLTIISFYKTSSCFGEELINVVCFTLLGCILGSYTRKAQLQNFDSLEQLRISREQYRLAAAHSNGVICEFDVLQRCVRMKPEMAAIYDTAKNVSGVPYEPVKQGLIGKDSCEAYINFYEAIIRGEKTGTAEFQSYTTEGWRWQRATFTTIYSDIGKPLSAVISLIDITEQRAQEEVQRIKAENDGLTGIYNRATTEYLINQALAEKAQGAFLLIDLDNLKVINDMLGHPQGDAALRAIARTLRNRFRQTDIVGRVGGDEFVVFLRGLNTQEEVSALLEKLMAQIAENQVGEHSERQLTVSIGVATYHDGSGSFEALYKKADVALYQQKKAGKNGFTFFRE